MKTMVSFLLISGLFSVAAAFSAAQDETVRELSTTNKKMEVLADRHSFLHDEFIKGKKCVWNEDKTRLIEVTLARDVEISSEISLPLPSRTPEVFEFFDVLMFRSDSSLEDVKAVTLIDNKGDSISLNEFGFREGILMFWLPRNFDRESSVKLSVSSDEPIEFSDVGIRSKRGVDSDFKKMKEWWFTLPKSRFSDVAQAFLDETAKMTFEELNRSLNQNSEALLKIIVPARLPSTGPSICVWGILADRRVSKIHEILSTLDRDTAAKLAEANFNSEFEAFRATWETGGIVPYRTNHAIESQLFLCSEFCSVEQVNGILNRWNDWYGKHKDSMDFQFESRAKPDFLLVASLQMKMLMEKKHLSLREANRWLVEIMPDKGSDQARLNSLALQTSDSTPNRPGVIKSIPLFDSHYQFMGPESKQYLLTVLQAELSPAN